MDRRELLKYAEDLRRFANARPIEMMGAAFKIAEIIDDLKKTAGITAGHIMAALGGAAAGAGTGYYLTKRHDLAVQRRMMQTLPEITTPREKQIMEQMFAYGYNAALEDIQKALSQKSAKKKASGELTQEEKLRRSLEKIAEILEEAANEIERLENEKKVAETQLKMRKVAEKMVNNGLAVSIEDAERRIKTAMQNGADSLEALEALIERRDTKFF